MKSQISQLQAAVKWEKREKEIILSSLSDLVLYQDTEQNIIWANPAAAASVQREQQGLIGKKCYSVWHGRENPCPGCPVIKALSTGEVKKHVMTSPDGRIWDVTGSPLFDETNTIVGVIESTREITAIVKAERELQKLNEELEERVSQRTQELEQVNRELDAFTYSVSHDLREPLRSLDGFSLAILEDYGDILDIKGQDYLRRIRAASQRMGLLIDDLLKLSRINRQTIQRERVDLSSIIYSLICSRKEEEPDRNVKAVIAPGITVSGDASLLKIALENLLDNAWKFTGNRKETCIEFGCRQEEGQEIFYLQDNGVGFDMTYADKLFTAFQRLHRAEEYPGTGIGLSIVARVIRRHGGEVWAKGERDQGAVFSFTLPL